MMYSKKCLPDNLMIVGYTTRSHLLLDLDDTTFEKAYRLSYKIMRQWKIVGDCLIVKSSDNTLKIELRYSWNNKPYVKVERDNYHLIFNNRIGYNNCCKICETLAHLNVLERDYMRIRTFRGDMTLRASPAILMKGTKPTPRPVMRCLNLKSERQDGMIDVYLDFLDACRRLFPIADVVPEVRADRRAYAGPHHQQSHVQWS